jgi:hypothetical protein
LKKRTKKLLLFKVNSCQSRSVGILFAAAVAVQAALFAGVLARTMILRPFWDMITWIDAFLASRQTGGFLPYLWAPHNEHHLVLIRLLTALDVSVFQGSGIPFVVAATAALVMTVVLVTSELHRGAGLPRPLRVLVLLGPMLLLTTDEAVDCSIPIDSNYPLTVLFIVAALILFDGEPERTGRTGVRRVASLFAAALAALANAAGLVIWPVLLWLAWRGGARRPWLLTVGATGLVYCFVYVQGLPGTGSDGFLRFLSAGHFWKRADDLLMYLGLPLSRAPALGVPARILGAALLAAGLAAIWHDATLPCPASRLHRIAIGLIMAGIAAAFLAAAGRADLQAEVKVPVRYAVMVAPLRIGLLALALPFLVARATTPRRQMALLAVATFSAAVLILLQIGEGRSAIAVSEAIAATLDRYDAGVRARGMERVVFPDLATADRVTATLRRKNVEGKYP